MFNRLVRQSPAITLAIIVIPCLAGLVGTLLPAFDYFPDLDRNTPSLNVIGALLEHPQFYSAAWQTIWTGFTATILAYLICIVTIAWLQHRPIFFFFRRALSPLLSVPHVTFAIGIVYLLSGHGWLVRLFAKFANWDTPLDRFIFPDNSGLGFILLLALRELPFLFLMSLTALNNIPFDRYLLHMRLNNYSPVMSWLIAVQPAIHKRMRLPLYAVLIFSLSVVDMAILTAPQNPAPLQVLMLQWYSDANVNIFLPLTAAASLVYLVFTPIAILGLHASFRFAGRIFRYWCTSGYRGHGLMKLPVASFGLVTLGLIYISLFLIVLWSFAASWRFPNIFPSLLSLKSWHGALGTFFVPFLYSLFLALTSATIGTLLVIFSLEAITRSSTGRGLIYLRLSLTSLILPQQAFLFGIQILFSRLYFFSPSFTLIWCHLIFIIPYCLLTLGDPWLHFNKRYLQTAACCGLSQWQQFWRIRLPMMLQPILITWAVGFSVSLALYLPNQLIGRTPTLTTEAIVLASSGNMRIIGLCGVLQIILPFAAFFLANQIPNHFRKRRGWHVPKLSYGFRNITE